MFVSYTVKKKNLKTAKGEVYARRAKEKRTHSVRGRRKRTRKPAVFTGKE